jgi:hypothetical protein
VNHFLAFLIATPALSLVCLLFLRVIPRVRGMSVRCNSLTCMTTELCFRPCTVRTMRRHWLLAAPARCTSCTL